ncbi:hypothetical protein WS80_24080 [Burkholderia pseudomultivorans]|nr:hypothetical protein WS80_24080 [Burkholderia pseudomultivorans]
MQQGEHDRRGGEDDRASVLQQSAAISEPICVHVDQNQNKLNAKNVKVRPRMHAAWSGWLPSAMKRFLPSRFVMTI